MNRRSITRVLQKKHDDYVASIKDEGVRKLVEENSIITGGSIASLLLNEKVKDFDYYFADKATVEAVANYYVGGFNEAHPEIKIKPEVQVYDDRVKIVVQSAGVVSENGDEGYRYFENYPDEVGMEYVDKVVTDADETDSKHMEEMDKERGKYRPIFMSSNAITLSDKIQLVIRFYGNAEEIHKNYDFIHCCNYWTSSDGKLTLNPGALESLLVKNLQYQGSLYPLCSIIRTRKFLKNGWYINAGQYLKMCFQLSGLNLSDINVLEEQLTGVDAAYFFQVIEYCKKRQEEDKEFKITTPYLVGIIDKIFG
jgi:hypothetical protein